MSHLNSPRANTPGESFYAAPEDFEAIFTEQNTDLLRLSLQLTADAEKAEACLVLTTRDCYFRSRIPKVQVRAWVRRLVIRNAVRLLWGTPDDILCNPDFEFYLQPGGYALDLLRESIAILGLPVLDRLAFVICVLERFSVPDCAVFLRKTPVEVHAAILRAIHQVIGAEERTNDDSPTATSHNGSGPYLDGETYLKSSGGSILNYDCQ